MISSILPEGYGFVATGQAKPVSDAFNSMVMALTIAILFIFFVLAAQFESYIDPLAITIKRPRTPHYKGFEAAFRCYGGSTIP